MSSGDDDLTRVGEVDASKAVEGVEELTSEMVEDHNSHVFIQFAPQRNIANTLIPFQVGKGVHFWDLKGKKYLDFASQLFNLQLGHQHPHVIDAIQKQAAQACYIRPTSNTYSVRSRFAKKLASKTPGDLNKILFTTAGSDAVEYAVKVAKMVTGRDKVCTFYRSYHGSTFGCKSFGGDPKNWAGGSNLPGVYRVHNPYTYRCPFGYPEGNLDVYVKHVIDTIEYEGPHLTACLLAETISGYAGLVIIPPPGFWQRIYDYCQSKGIVFIADEVMTGYGRTGKLFAIEHWNVVPDMITSAKGITNGAIPLGACIVSDRIAKHFDDNVFFAGLTYSGHPLAMAAGLAVLEAFEQENVLERCTAMGVVLKQQLETLKQRNAHVVGEVRSLGLLGAIELVLDVETREPVSDPKVLASIDSYLVSHGLYTFARWNTIGICPPLIISERELQVGLDIIEACIRSHFPPTAN